MNEIESLEVKSIESWWLGMNMKYVLEFCIIILQMDVVRIDSIKLWQIFPFLSL